MKDPMQVLADMQADAAAEVLSDLSGWPVKDCRFAWEKMNEAANKATIQTETFNDPPVGNEFPNGYR